MFMPLTITIELALIYSLVALGVYLSFRIINFPDLTVDGTLPLGASVAAILLTKEYHPLVATLVATGAGVFAGMVTGYLHVRFRIMGLLAGILVMTALYSINIHVMGKPNIALLNVETLFSDSAYELYLLAAIIIAVFMSIKLFLASQYGLALRASGINPKVSRSYGVNVDRNIIVILAISNGLVALAGALLAQIQGFADVSLGIGTITIGLAAVMIGEAFLSAYRGLFFKLIGCLLGSLLYRVAVGLAMNNQLLGLQSTDLNMITAILIAVALMMPRLRIEKKNNDTIK